MKAFSNSIYFIIFFSSFLASCPYTSPAKAQELKDRQAGITRPLLPSNEEIQRKRFVSNFLQAALSETYAAGFFSLPREDNKSSGVVYQRALLKKEYPWFYEYLYQETGQPKGRAINKWVTPVTFSFGYPNDLRPFSQPRDSREVTYFNDGGIWDDPEAESILKEQVDLMAPALSEIVGLPVSYIQHNQEATSYYGSARIVFLPARTNGANFKKELREEFLLSGMAESVPPKLNFRGGTEGYLSDMVYYTPSLDDRVEGYFLPNGRNEIGLSVCYVHKDPDIARLKVNIRECIYRSMGIPDSISQWTGDKSLVRVWWRNGYQDGFDDIGNTHGMSAFDKEILGALYRKDIRPGMSAIEVQQVLLKDQ